MEPIIIRNRGEVTTPRMSKRWKVGSIVVGCIAVVSSLSIFVFHQQEVSDWFLAVVILLFCSMALLHARFLYWASEERRYANNELRVREQEFQSIFENALDAILVLDEAAICQSTNPSAMGLFKIIEGGIIGKAISHFWADKQEFDSLWHRLLTEEKARGESKLVHADGAVIFVEFTAKARVLPGRHLMILRDITLRRLAEEAMDRHLASAKSAWQEANALRTATLALTRDLRMDHVLDTLLDTLHLLVPYEEAQILLLETETKWFLAREVYRGENGGHPTKWPETLNAPDYPIVARTLGSPVGMLIPDTAREKEWRPFTKATDIRAWIGISLVASHRILGLISLGHTVPGAFSPEHLRLTNSLAIPASAAIQNARLYEQTEIYGAELERRLMELHQTEDALQQSEGKRRASEERFKKLFRATPVPFSVTTLRDGRFLDVNEAFERRYGYTRQELIGRTSSELGFWEDPQERIRLVEALGREGRIRGRISRFRLKSGEWRVSFYSAETIG